MSKKQLFGIIFLAVLAGWLFNFFAGNYFLAKFSTWPALNRWKILSPQAPIVINNHDIKSKIGSIALVNGTSAVFTGTAINLTSDGSFVTAAGSFKNKAVGTYYVILDDGTSGKITQQTSDSATSLIFFKAALSSVPVVNLAASGDVSVGDRILFVQDSLQKFYAKTLSASVEFSQKDVEGQIFLSDYPGRSFGAAANGSLVPGEALVNTNGDITGIWNGSGIVSSDVLKQAMALYFNNSQKIQRPSFGFSYSIVTQSDSGLTGLPEGAVVKTVDVGSSARAAGLTIGDVITSVGNQTVSESSPLEEILQQYKPGEQISLTVNRKNQTVNLNLTVGELK
jgi:S1-C subfamily serine protease